MEGCCGMMGLDWREGATPSGGGLRDGIRERCVVGNQSTETVG